MSTKYILSHGSGQSHFRKIFRYVQFASSGSFDIFNGKAFADFSQSHAFLLVDLKHTLKTEKEKSSALELKQSYTAKKPYHFSDDHINTIFTSQRQIARLHKLVFATFSCMLHSDDNLGSSR